MISVAEEQGVDVPRICCLRPSRSWCGGIVVEVLPGSGFMFSC